ncbi:MAG TPA: serine/threonine-protein kinase [Pyrinomonadaceae bacterium]|nr:serine/threonine-protein kinase [Pyrinomonadaceae bacterium]
MKAERWRQVDELFEQALERAEGERARFLDAACAGDSSLRREVEEMLRFDERAAEFIETPVFGVAAALIGALPEDSPTPRIPSYVSARRPSPSRGLDGSPSIDESRFVPGDVLAARYRIAGLLGRGGMGEVYRADDLKLRQPVALKFLPEALSSDGASLARFYQEVSVARQVSHRHVCRVYDVAEAEGFHFISMEYVRGEALSSLLKRIGRLPEDKAVETARQLCAGLAAVHDAGVLHKDLKPANVMIDERGDVRITDFGIAALASDARSRDSLAGTPAYMSPEHLEGRELTTKSDLYSLGLVLYELFTGRKAFEASSLPELLKLRRSDTHPSSPSSHIKDLDPLVERVIFRCLERDPDSRPASALQVAAALPGGDPLAAALAAGETPSPEMVAAAPKEGGLSPAVAVSLLASLFVLLGLACYFSKDVGLYNQVPLDKSPEVLRDHAAELTKRLGYASTPADSAYGMGVDDDYLNFIRDTDTSPARWEGLRAGRPASIYFWQRQSPRPFDVLNGERVSEWRPARDLAGMTTVTLDTLGRLRSFYAVPTQTNTAPADAREFDWSILFAESGLDFSQFRAVAPAWATPHAYTSRAAWEGAYPERPEFKVRVEAAAYGGSPVFFELIDAWDKPPEQQGAYTESARERLLSVILLTVFITVLVGSALLAWRNLRLGRGDRKGAARIAVFMLAVNFLRWLFTAHHVATEDEAVNFLSGVRNAVFWACFFWVVYLALEPYVRRRWPWRIISWTRLLAGNWRDPLVGRDMLVGAVFGAGVLLCNFFLGNVVPRWLGYPPNPPWFDFPATQLLGVRSFAGSLSTQVYAAFTQPFILLFLILLFRMLLRSDRLASLAVALIGAAALSLTHEAAAAIPFAVFSAFLMVFCLHRYGLLAACSAVFVLHLNIFYPVTSHFTAWYAGDFVPALLITLALAVYGFRTSLAGRPLLRGRLLED